MKVEVLELAKQEFDEAFSYYEACRKSGVVWAKRNPGAYLSQAAEEGIPGSTSL